MRRVGSNALPEKELQIIIHGSVCVSADGGCWDVVVTVHTQQFKVEPPLKGPSLRYSPTTFKNFSAGFLVMSTA